MSTAGRAAPYRPVAELDVGDLEVLRLVLHGGSVVDWRRLHFRDAAEVDHFLRMNLFDLSDPRDERRIRSVLEQAVEYLRGAFGYRVAESVARPADLRHLFLLASGHAEPARNRRIACVVLKCMHVVHHLEARELLFRTALREADLAERVDRRVTAVARQMAADGFPVVEFHGNVKNRTSLVSKMLVKRETLAAQVFDRVRYRLVVRTPDQIAPVLHHLFQVLFPFNYLVPGQTLNSLLEFREVLALHPRGAQLGGHLQPSLDPEEPDRRKSNPFSGKGYRVLNFVVDVPVRIDDLVPEAATLADDLGRVVFSLVEFQVTDEETARLNEQGASAHVRYKKRQMKIVLRRLSKGLVVPRRPRREG
jgi:uncharacterized protein (TIGR04552 family)